MDTPQKTQITAPLSKVEDSPVFNYINNLSPIKPVKSLHITQTFNPLNLASARSIFASPHVIAHKESRFLKRHYCTEPSKPNSEEGNKVIADEEAATEITKLCDKLASLKENSEFGVSMGDDGSFEPPNINEAKFVSELVCASPSVIPFAHEMSKKGTSEDCMDLDGVCQSKQKIETPGGDWENLLSNAPDLLNFSPPEGLEAIRELPQKSENSGSRSCTSPISQSRPLLQTGEADEPKASNQLRASVENECSTSDPTSNVDDESVPYLYRGLRRRCLDFESQGAQRKTSDDDSKDSSSGDKQLVPLKPVSDKSRCISPGIGLHLNALANASRDNRSIKYEVLSSRRQNRSFPSSTDFIIPLRTTQEAFCASSVSAAAEREMEPTENGIDLAEDTSQASANLVIEEINQNSPQKKRQKLESAGEGGACKRCNCKKSKCLKLYCECFAAGLYCIEPCSCQDCFNKPIHEDTVHTTRNQILSRNPLAFAPKVIRNSDSIREIRDEYSTTPASARHKSGCNCKKSSCLKKYCECYQGGVGCSVNCRCEGCKNAFGRKGGSAIMEIGGGPEEETREDNGWDRSLQNPEILNDQEQNLVPTLPTTPLQLCRPLVLLPFSSKGKPPRSFTKVGSSSWLFNGQRYAKPSILHPQNKIEEQVKTITEEETPEVLRGVRSPITGVKTLSPNSKRVSPPQQELGSLPLRKGGRKLILKSIPSFPSLTQQ